MADTLPFLVEYAKSGRASCQACKDTIEKMSLRIAKVVQVSLQLSHTNLSNHCTNFIYEKLRIVERKN